MNGASIAAVHAVSAPRSDETDDEVMQRLALAINVYKSRFGEEALIDCLEDLLETIKD